MKNKHLVLLFFTVLFLGLLCRYLPVRYRPFFKTALIQVDSAAVTRCLMQRPGSAELNLLRTETGWVADQEGRTSPVAPAEITHVLGILSRVHSLRTVKTGQPDTLGFSDILPFRIRLFQENHLVEHFELGAEIFENGQAATYLRLPMHEGVYLVPGHLRRVFGRSIDEFRAKTVVETAPEAVRRISVGEAGRAPVLWVKNDSTRRWESSETDWSLSDDSVQTWLRLLGRLNHGPFADNFDESSASETRITRFHLENADSVLLTLDFFYLKPPEVPEDLSILRNKRLPDLPVYVVQSSRNPLNYFAVKDTHLARLLCFGWWRHPSTVPSEDSIFIR